MPGVGTFGGGAQFEAQRSAGTPGYKPNLDLVAEPAELDTNAKPSPRHAAGTLAEHVPRSDRTPGGVTLVVCRERSVGLKFGTRISTLRPAALRATGGLEPA
jgi:hypothetical protein